MGLLDFLFKKKRKAETIAASLTSSSNCDKPTPKQAIEKLPAEWQLTKATKLGINVTDGMTYSQLEKLLSNAEYNKPPTHQQLKKAKAFGVSVPVGTSYGQLSESLEKALSNQPATSEQVEICKRVGIPLQSTTTRGQADELILKAKSNPKYRANFQQIEDEEMKQLEEEEDRELREKYGDKFIDEFRRWEKISNESGSQHLMIYRKGKGIAVEVIEFDIEAEIVEGKSPYIKLALLLPKKESFEKGWYSLEWDHEAEVRSSNVLYIQKLEKPFINCEVMLGQESKDFVEYRKVLEKATVYAKKFESS